jgi:hypothetical protein
MLTQGQPSELVIAALFGLALTGMAWTYTWWLLR